jgi:hypothetical protein
MSTTSSIPADLMADLKQALDRAIAGIRDAEAREKACESMDRRREENCKLFGVQNIAVDLVRDARR